MDEILFGGKRPGKRGWGTSGKIGLRYLSEKQKSPCFSYLFQSHRDHDTEYCPIY